MIEADRTREGASRGTKRLAAGAAAWALALAACGGGAEPDRAAPADGATGGETPAPAAEPAPAAAEAPAEDAAAGDDAAGDGAAVGEGAETAPDTEAAWRAQVRRGRRVYDRVCETCHPGGDEDLGPRIIGKRLTVAQVRRQIRQGVGRMRPIPPSKLPERYMDDLMAYLSTLRVVRDVARN